MAGAAQKFPTSLTQAATSLTNVIDSKGTDLWRLLYWPSARFGCSVCQYMSLTPQCDLEMSCGYSISVSTCL
jgi:hypothetical protein